jgi:hypothetical protein
MHALNKGKLYSAKVDTVIPTEACLSIPSGDHFRNYY